jgi:hypothetical protein
MGPMVRKTRILGVLWRGNPLLNLPSTTLFTGGEDLVKVQFRSDVYDEILTSPSRLVVSKQAKKKKSPSQ